MVIARMAVVAVTAHVVTEAIAVAVMVAMQVVVVTSIAKSAARVWLTPHSAPSAMRWSMPRKPCASWPLKPTAKP